MTSQELIESFYQKFKEKYPEISLEEMKKICSSEFIMMKEVMESGELEDIRLQYLFVAKVSQARVIKHLKDIYKKKAAGKLTNETFSKYNSLLLNHINNNPEKFKKYEDRIKSILGEH